MFGPLAINYVFILEDVDLNLNLAFSAGDMLGYYGAVLGGLVTCFAIISTLHINSLNIKEDRERAKFEHAYETYHKLPDIMSRLELAAIHVQYSIHISEDALIETLDIMKECDNVLREQHFLNDNYSNKRIDTLLTRIIDASAVCQERVERHLREMESTLEDYEPPHEELEAAFNTLRESIGNAKSEITNEINKFMFKNENA